MPEEPAASGEAQDAAQGDSAVEEIQSPTNVDNPSEELDGKHLLANIATLFGRLIFGGLFFYAGLLKAKDPLTFLDAVRGFKLVGDPWAAWVAMGLPWLEILCGACVLTGMLYRGALAILCGAVCAFIFAIARAWAIGLDVNCGCFGESTPTSDYRTEIIQRVVFLAIGLALFVAAWLQAKKKIAATAS